jgi:hypothetical protein
MYASLRNILAAVLLLTSVHGRREDKLLYVPVHVGGHGPYWFAVDSGAHNSVIDPFIVEELGLTVTGTMTTKGTGEGDVPVRTVAPLDMRIGDVTLKIAEPWVIDLSGVPIPKWVHGLVGAEFFEAYVVELDPERATMRFFDPATFRKPHGAVAVPLEDANHRFFMRVTIDVNGKEHVERRVRIDTGSGDSVGDEIVRKGRRVRETTLGQGLGSDYKSVSGLVDAVHIGPFAVHNVWGPATRFPAIGMEMLRRFTMTFDVPHRALYLQPNAHLGDAVPPPEH